MHPGISEFSMNTFIQSLLLIRGGHLSRFIKNEKHNQRNIPHGENHKRDQHRLKQGEGFQ